MNYRVYEGTAERPVYETTVLPVPYNETEQAEFVVLAVEGKTELIVRSQRAVTKAIVRPMSLGIRAEISDAHTIRLCLEGPCNLSLEINGSARGNLCVFASPRRRYAFSSQDKNVYYYPAGEHDIDKTIIRGDDVIVYLEDGAHLTGKFEFNGCRRLLVCGRGRVECGKYTDVRHRVCLDLVGVSQARVEDICVLDSTFWCIRLLGCENVTIDNVKIIGWRGNTDGIDVCGSRHVLVDNVFTRVWDDSLVVKGIDATDRHNVHLNYPGTDSDFSAGFEGLGDVRDVCFRRCVLWNDFARPIEIGVSLRADEVTDLRYEDIDIIHSSTGYPLMGVHHGDRADVHGVIFERIRIEDAPGAQLFDLRMTNSVWSTDARKGRIRDVLFRDIALVGDVRIPPVDSRLEGLNEEHGIENIAFENVSLSGRYAKTARECHLDIRDFVKNVTFSSDDALPEIRLVSSSLELTVPFAPDGSGRYRGTVRLTLRNESRESASGNVRLNVSPVNLAACAESAAWSLPAGSEFSREYDLTLQAGRYLLSVDGGVEVESAWMLLTLDGRAAGFECDFVNYYGDCPGAVSISVRNDALCLEGDILADASNSLTVYAARSAAVRQGEVLFTAEETDFGECNAVIWGPHGEELAPQLRCPGEITYVFKNQPAVSGICRIPVESGGGRTAEIPLSRLPSGPGALLLEIELKRSDAPGRRYPFTLFHSVIPGQSAHMFVRIPDA